MVERSNAYLEVSYMKQQFKLDRAESYLLIRYVNLSVRECTRLLQEVQGRLIQRARWPGSRDPKPQGGPKQPMRYFFIS